MIGVVALQIQVRARHSYARMSSRAILAPGGRQSKLATDLPIAE
jgi:hypothetical protein